MGEWSPNLKKFIAAAKKYMLFAGWEVRMVKNCDRGLENTARGRWPRAAFLRPDDWLIVFDWHFESLVTFLYISSQLSSSSSGCC